MGYKPGGSNAKYSKTGGGAREPLISIRQLTTTSADYLPSTHPITLSDKQPTNRLGTFLANLKLITKDRWVLHAVSGYKIPFLSLPHQW